jgi:Amt family ammonium transporter
MKYLSLIFILFSTQLFAQELDTGTNAWLMTSTALVLFMTIPGLAAFYSGLVAQRNVLSVLMHCFVICCTVTVLWILYGYTMTFGSTINGMVGSIGPAFLSSISIDSMSVSGNFPETTFVMFQLTFAIITPALIVGAFVERVNFSPMILFVIAWMTLVYFPVAHWIWGGGWLGDMGYRDFAGGAVVHTTAGIAAIVFAIFLGPRKGFPRVPMPPHNLPLTVLGAGMLWVGWFGFNGGSALAADGAASMAILVTHISASVAALVWAGIEWVKFGKPSVLGVVTGMVAGLATITPASGFVGPLGAFMIGITAGAGCFYATQSMKKRFGIDDSLDVFPVHGVGGVMGLLLTAIFSSEQFGGLGLDEGVSIMGQLNVQILGTVAVIIWTLLVSYILLKLINGVLPVRASEWDEIEGLDISTHDEKGYNLDNI